MFKRRWQLRADMLDVLGVAATSARAFGLLVGLPTGDALSTLPRLLIAVGFALAVTPASPSHEPISGVVLAFEFCFGIFLSLPARFVAEAAEMLGEVLDTARGQTIGSVVDPLNGQAVSDMATLLRLGVVVLVISLGGIDACIEVLKESFQTIPLGAVDLPAAPLYQIVWRGVAVITGALSIGGIWLVGYLMIDIATALLAKVVQGMYFSSTAVLLKMVVTFSLLAMLLEYPGSVVRFVSTQVLSPISFTTASGAGSADPVDSGG